MSAEQMDKWAERHPRLERRPGEGDDAYRARLTALACDDCQGTGKVRNVDGKAVSVPSDSEITAQPRSSSRGLPAWNTAPGEVAPCQTCKAVEA